MENKNMENTLSSLDIDFVKKSKRYPLTFSPIRKQLIASITILLVILTLSFFSITKYSESPNSKNLLFMGSDLMLIGIFIVYVFNFINNLKFKVIKTSSNAKTNYEETKGFLERNNYKYFENNELFAINSTKVFTGDDIREIVIFIVNSEEILINNIILNSNLLNSSWLRTRKFEYSKLVKNFRAKLS